MDSRLRGNDNKHDLWFSHRLRSLGRSIFAPEFGKEHFRRIKVVCGLRLGRVDFGRWGWFKKREVTISREMWFKRKEHILKLYFKLKID